MQKEAMTIIKFKRNLQKKMKEIGFHLKYSMDDSNWGFNVSLSDHAELQNITIELSPHEEISELLIVFPPEEKGEWGTDVQILFRTFMSLLVEKFEYALGMVLKKEICYTLELTSKGKFERTVLNNVLSAVDLESGLQLLDDAYRLTFANSSAFQLFTPYNEVLSQLEKKDDITIIRSFPSRLKVEYAGIVDVEIYIEFWRSPTNPTVSASTPYYAKDEDLGEISEERIYALIREVTEEGRLKELIENPVMSSTVKKALRDVFYSRSVGRVGRMPVYEKLIELISIEKLHALCVAYGEAELLFEFETKEKILKAPDAIFAAVCEVEGAIFELGEFFFIASIVSENVNNRVEQELFIVLERDYENAIVRKEEFTSATQRSFRKKVDSGIGAISFV